MIVAIVAAGILHTFAPTPQAAALRALYARPGTVVRVTRVNRAGRFAMVLSGGGLMESSPVNDPILIERFSFGWQPLEVVSDTCDKRFLDAVAGTEAAVKLLAGMQLAVPSEKCEVFPIDRGSAVDVAAVRAQMRGPLIPYVLVSRDWALAQWYGAGGGDGLFHRVSGRWVRKGGGGGAMDIDILRAFGVPLADACRLRAGLAVRNSDAVTCRSSTSSE